mgnify:CR=1 FL=1|jgi:hypothetical protein
MKKQQVLMPWGKHKGVPVSKLPDFYLKWVAENWRERTPLDVVIIKAADKEYRRRVEDGEFGEDNYSPIPSKFE